MKYTKKAEYLYGKGLLEARHPVLKEFLEKEDRETKELLEKLSPCRYPFRKEAEQRAAHRD